MPGQETARDPYGRQRNRGNYSVVTCSNMFMLAEKSGEREELEGSQHKDRTRRGKHRYLI